MNDFQLLATVGCVLLKWKSHQRYELHVKPLPSPLLWAEPALLPENNAAYYEWAVLFLKYMECYGKPEGRRSLGKPRHGWEDSIRMDLREMVEGKICAG